jgi:hypothetical protein
MVQAIRRLLVSSLIAAAAPALAACGGGSAGAPAFAPNLANGTDAGATSPFRAAGLPAPDTVPVLGGCSVFPADNPWNADISQSPVDPNNANYMAHMHAGTTFLHPDFGHNPHYGIPFELAPASTPFVPITFTAYGSQSDPGPYPIPHNARIEGGSKSNGDRHVLAVYEGTCHLYEMYRSFHNGAGWKAASGAIFDLSSNKLRPDCWTSADAAGLPITPGLPKVDEVIAGVINHAMRFTVGTTQAAYVHPATHFASSSTNPNDPPMGLRVRLKAAYNLSGFHGQSLVILTALKKYGAFLADNGSDWYFTGSTDSRWNDNDLNQIKSVPASAFEVVQLGQLFTHC